MKTKAITVFLCLLLTLPCTPNDLLAEGFEIREDEEHRISYNEENKRGTGFLTYYGTRIGGFAVEHCESEEEVLDAPLRYLSLSFLITKPRSVLRFPSMELL